jgi:hypothetical protein
MSPSDVHAHFGGLETMGGEAKEALVTAVVVSLVVSLVVVFGTHALYCSPHAVGTLPL